jgi:hypothetical protein
MAPKHHPTPLSGGDRKALKKELGRARYSAGIASEAVMQKDSVYQPCVADDRYSTPGVRVSFEIGRELCAFIGDEDGDQLGGLRVACVRRNDMG